MKNRKKTLIIIYLIIVSILFIICSIFWYNATKESYEYNNFKETLVEEVRENPDLFKKEFNIDNEEQLTPEVINDIYTKSTSKRYELIASISLPISIIGGLILISPILIIISTIKKYRKYRLSIDNFKQNTGYYRDLLKNYNPLELSYNNDYNLDDNALIAMILYLEKKKILTLKNENFIINEENINNLNELEKSFIDQIKNSKKVTFEISRSAITNLTDVSCKKKKLLIMDNIPKKKIIIDLIKAFIFYIILFIVWINLNKIFDMLPPTNGMFIVFTELGVFIALLLFILFYPFVIIMKYSFLDLFTQGKHAKRTDLGNEINYKLDGLKNFIRDFSSLDERTKEEIILWDDYLIYSVLFGDNKKIYNEMKDKIKYII